MRTAILLALIVLVACSQQTPTGNVVKVQATNAVTSQATTASVPKTADVPKTGPYCTEDDGGNDPNERGITKGVDASGKQFEYVDECIGTIVAENYCEGNAAKTANKRCSKECERGQCWD